MKKEVGKFVSKCLRQFVGRRKNVAYSSEVASSSFSSTVCRTINSTRTQDMKYQDYEAQILIYCRRMQGKKTSATYRRQLTKR